MKPGLLVGADASAGIHRAFVRKTVNARKAGAVGCGAHKAKAPVPSRSTIPARQDIGDDTPLRLDVRPRRGLSRVDAAAYVGISPCKFDEMVADGRMPKPRRIDTRKVWDVRELDLSFEALPQEDSPATGSSWDDR